MIVGANQPVRWQMTRAPSWLPWSPTRVPSSVRRGIFGYPVFAAIWTASIFSNVGLAMFDTGSGWLMTILNANPVAVSLVQVAAMLPMFLLTLPAGVLSDIVDSRRLLIVAEALVAAVPAVFAALVSFRLATPGILLFTVFVLGAAGALSAPALMAIVPQLVNRPDLDGAIAADGVGYEFSRAVGPVLGGVSIAMLGTAAPFWVMSASTLPIIGALIWWRPPPRAADSLPAERFITALRTGLRHVANNAHMRATLARGLGIFPFASAYWALLPLIASTQTAGGSERYGILLGAIGAGGIVGSLALNSLKARLGPDCLEAAGVLGNALALVVLGFAREPLVALCACLIAGMAWTIVLASLFVSAQVALPSWVRGRGLAILLATYFGATTVGSVIWGKVASMAGLPTALTIAAAGAVLAIPLTWRWKLQTAAAVDLSPSLHWRTPTIAGEVAGDRGPVLVTIEYRVDQNVRATFLRKLGELGYERKRDGAFRWRVFEDAADPDRIMEIFLVGSWLEHMHQHRRVTNADRVLQTEIGQLLTEAPRVSHLLASGQTSLMSGRKKRKAT